MLQAVMIQATLACTQFLCHYDCIFTTHKEARIKYRVILEQDEDGIFVAQVPALPGCISQGETRAVALKNIQEAIEAYLESLKKHDEPVPPSINEEVVEVAV